MRRALLVLLGLGLGLAPTVSAQTPDPRLDRLKEQALQLVEKRSKLVQEIIDHLYSFAELGMQEFETQRYLTGLLEKEGFTVQRGVAGMPSAWTARWSRGTGRPVIALGSDIDGLPQTNQQPGKGFREPQVAELAPGHGEGHNTGQALNIVGALAVKEIMEKENVSGTILLWPGVAEEQIAAKAFMVRDGVFDGVDVNLFAHVSSNFGVSWGTAGGNAVVSVQFRFHGQTAHSAGSPWSGRSALDAVMLMANAWEFKREHLQPASRSHYVITEGGDQPNVVPSSATIWFYFRERDYPRTKAMYDDAVKMAQGAALMTGTEIDTIQILGSAWGRHFSKPVAEAMYANIQRVGLPEWDEKDQALATAMQRELGQRERGLADSIGPLTGPVDLERSLGGGSDDIGDVSWNMPTVTLSYPANIPGMIGHHWSSGIAAATPIAHKGGVAGAKVQALTLLDLFLDGTTVAAAKDYFVNVQTKDVKYTPFISADDKPATFLNADIMEKYRPLQRPFYYDATKYKTYLEQLGIEYPTLKPRPVSD